MQRILQLSPRLTGHLHTSRERVESWLQTGTAPRQLAFTLALGFAIGCIPLLGITTAICALLALVLRLNMPAIQAANWIAMPLQFVLLIPFLRMGQYLIPGHGIPGHGTAFSGADVLAQIESAPWHAFVQMSSLFGYGLVAWLIAAGPCLLLLTLLLTPLMQRVSRLSAAMTPAE